MRSVWLVKRRGRGEVFRPNATHASGGASLRVAGALWARFIVSRAPWLLPSRSRREYLDIIHQHATTATGVLILTKHLLHPKSDPKSEGGGTWAVGRRRSRRVEGGRMARHWRLGGAHERAAHDDSFAARRDVRELLFDVSFVDGVITL